MSRRYCKPSLLGLAALALLVAGPGDRAHAQQTPYPSNSVHWGALPMPPGAPGYLGSTWHSMLQAPLPNAVYPTPGVPPLVPQQEYDPDATGTLGLYQPNGATVTAGNAFFQSLGTNGRSCVTCHQPNNAFGLSLSSINQRYLLSFGHDPLFAPVDAATCPKNVPANATSGSIIGGWKGTGGTPGVSPYYTLLTRGVIRIPLPIPGAQFVITNTLDPWGCNTTAPYNQVVNAGGSTSAVLSVYRRPLISANLRFKLNTDASTGTFPPIDPVTGTPLAHDPTGALESGNIMWDGREPTLSSQAIDATLSHAQALAPPTATQVAQMVAFESAVFTAQVSDIKAGSLTQNYASGGPFWMYLEGVPALVLPPNAPPAMTSYNYWSSQPSWSPEASVYRGQQIFNTRSFVINSVAGLNNIAAVGQNVRGTCAFCHGWPNGGAAIAPLAQLDVGVGGTIGIAVNSPPQAVGIPPVATDLPVFQVTCVGGATNPYHGSVMLTNDPGMAMTTGKCADVGRMTTPSLRGLAGHAPYFHDGSAPGLADVVNFYNGRFNIGLSAQDKQDLVNFLQAL